MSKAKAGKADFFVSYTAADAKIASWIAWELEEAGYSVVFQEWDIIPGSSFVTEMHGALERAEKMIAVISDAYFKSKFAMGEWDAAYANDPIGLNRTLIPVRVENFDVSGLAKPRVYIDIVGCDEEMAKQKLLDGVSGKRLKPVTPPSYPFGEGSPKIVKPSANEIKEASIQSDVYVPPVKKNWTDRDRNKFLAESFSKIQSYFEKAGEALHRTHSEIEVEIEPITKRKFICRLYVDGSLKNSCKVWISESFGGSQIGYCEGTGHSLDSDNSYNEMLAVNISDNQLYLNATMFSFYGTNDNFDKEKLLPEQAAEYLWRRSTSCLSY